MIQPQFDINDRVFVAEADSEQVTRQCPDCLGEKHWTVNTPAGEEFTMNCTTCARGFEGSHGVLYPCERHPSTRMLTVGSVHIDTNMDRPVSYMMQETGVGSGKIHYSENVFASREEAAKRAQQLCDKRDAEDAERREQIREHNKKEARRGYVNINADKLRQACLKHGGDAIWCEVTGFKSLRAKREPAGATKG